MSLNESQFQALMRTYDSRRIEAESIQQEHLSIVRKEIPEFSALEDEISGLALKYGRLLLSDVNVSLDELDLKLSELHSNKIELLKSHGYSSDYIEPAYTCPDCKDTGYIDNAKCHCFKQAEIELLYNQSNIKNQLQTENFANLREDFYQGERLSSFRNTVSFCHSFVDNFDSNYQNLLFCGTVGCGKSFLSCCISYELLKTGHSVIYFSASDLFSTMSDNMFKRNGSEDETTCNSDIFNCDLLVIDDLGTEIGGQLVNSSLFTCLNERHIRRKPTLISTNLDFKGIQERYSDRVFSRLLGTFNILNLTGPDLRIQYRGTN